MRIISRLTGFTWTDLLLAMEAWCHLGLAAILIRIPLGRKRLLEGAMSSAGALLFATVPDLSVRAHQIHLTPSDKSIDPFSTRILEATKRAHRFLPKAMTCLQQSLALVWMLQRRGLEAKLRIGCRRDGPELRFHAWVAGPTGTPIKTEDTESPFVSFVPVFGEPGASA